MNVSQPGKYRISDGFKCGGGSECQNCPAPDSCSLQIWMSCHLALLGLINPDHEECFTPGGKRPAAENLSQRSDKSHERHFSLSNFYLLLSPSARPLGTETDNVLGKFIPVGIQVKNPVTVMWSNGLCRVYHSAVGPSGGVLGTRRVFLIITGYTIRTKDLHRHSFLGCSLPPSYWHC